MSFIILFQNLFSENAKLESKDPIFGSPRAKRAKRAELLIRLPEICPLGKPFKLQSRFRIRS
jgi:hypothetical protein